MEPKMMVQSGPGNSGEEVMIFPRMYSVRQSFESTAVEDIPGTVRSELTKLPLAKIQRGHSVAITASSRGIANIVLIFKIIVESLKSFGAEPFIFPAMGSHGGATAEGQEALLALYGVTEANVGAPIVSSMETVVISQTEAGVPVFIDKKAQQADHILVVNRIKPHTKFKGPIESGLMKMMAFGMGKQKGADLYHKAAIQFTFPKIIRDVAREMLDKAPILGGLGIVENAYDQTAKIVFLNPRDMEEQEKTLLQEAKQMMPRLPFNRIDLLIIDEIGKDISGIGMDSNVTGRNRDLVGVFPHPTEVKRLFVRNLTDGSNGNAIGIGLSDITTKRLVDKINFQATYMNCITGNSLEKAAIPMHFETDREAIEVALRSVGLLSAEECKVVRIKNTLRLKEVELSEAYQEEVLQRLDLEVLEGPFLMEFDRQGNLTSMRSQGGWKRSSSCQGS